MNNLLNWGKSHPIPIKQEQNPFQKMQIALEKAMDDLYNTFESPVFSTKEFENLRIRPAIDIIEDEKHFKVEAEIPGMGEEDIQVSIDDGILKIKGEKETSKKDKDKNYTMREISYGSYERNIHLPDVNKMDIDKAKASFKKGMLWIDIPKKPGATQESKKLKIEKA